jgi:hypothetical protein
MPSKTPINSHWSFSQVSSPTWSDVKEEWTTCASFPTSVHVELRKQGRIPDPFKGLNEWDVQCEWWVRSALRIKAGHRGRRYVVVLSRDLGLQRQLSWVHRV